MTRNLSLISLMLVALLGLIIAGCGGGGSNGATVRGTVLDASGAAVTGATVTAGLLTAQTTATGYVLPGVPEGTAVVVKVSKSGYVSTQDVVATTNGRTVVLNFRLQEVGNSQAFANVNTTPVSLTDNRADTRNATVDIPAGAIVDADGNPVTSATVSVTTNLPSDAGYIDTFPGLFMGIATGDGVAKPIESFGFVDVELTDASGNKLKLDPTKPATITFPIDPANDPGDATIPVWWLNENTGVWEQDVDGNGNPVVATRTFVGGRWVYVAQVIHFSPHNLDRQFEGGTLTITVTDLATGGTVAGAWVTLWSSNGGTDPNGRWESRAVTNANGQCIFTNVPTGWLAATAGFGDREAEARSFDSTAGTMEISLPAPAGPVTVTVLDHQDRAVSGATVTLNSHGYSKSGTAINMTGTTGANGKYTFQNVPSAEFMMVSAYKGWLEASDEGPRKGSYTLTFEVPAATSAFEVTVVDTNGTTPVPSATVNLGHWGFAGFITVVSGTTDANGKASFAGVPESAFDIQAVKGQKTGNGYWYVGQPRSATVTLYSQAMGKRGK